MHCDESTDSNFIYVKIRTEPE